MARLVKLYTAAERVRDHRFVETVERLLNTLSLALGRWREDAGSGWIGLGENEPSPLQNIASKVEGALIVATPDGDTVPGDYWPGAGETAELIEAFGGFGAEIVRLSLTASIALDRLRSGR